MIPKRVDEKYFVINCMSGHKDYEKNNWLPKQYIYDIVEAYDSIFTGSEYVYKNNLYHLKRLIKITDYDYKYFKKFVIEFEDDLIAKYIAWLCAFDEKANLIKEAFEKETGFKVNKISKNKIKKYTKRENQFQQYVYEFRCSSPENEKYFQEYMEKIDSIFEKSDKLHREKYEKYKKRKERKK